MSWVLNATVTWDILEDTVQRLAEINAAPEREHGQAFANNDAEWYGGPKRMEATFFGAAFNHVPPSDVVAAVANAHWDSPDSVQLFLKDQEDDRWTLYEFSPAERLRPGRLIRGCVEDGGRKSRQRTAVVADSCDSHRREQQRVAFRRCNNWSSSSRLTIWPTTTP